MARATHRRRVNFRSGGAEPEAAAEKPLHSPQNASHPKQRRVGDGNLYLACGTGTAQRVRTPRVVDRAVADGGPGRVHSGEAALFQQRNDAGGIWPPPRGVVAVELRARIHDHRRTAGFQRVRMGFDNQHLARKCGDMLQRGDRILQMIEDAEEQHHVERSDPLRRQCGNVEFVHLDVDTQHRSREVEAFAGAQQRVAPDKIIRRQNPGRASAFGLKTVSPA